MHYKRLLTRKGEPMPANHWNMPDSCEALEIIIELVDEYLDSFEMEDREEIFSKDGLKHWEKHRGWYYLQFHHPNDDFFDIHNVGDGLLTSDNTLNGAYFWKTPEEAFHFILADCDLPRKQQVFKGYNICRICGPNIVKDEKGRFIHQEILWEAPADLGFPVVPCLVKSPEAF